MNEVLSHIGVKGMRWGRRKSSSKKISSPKSKAQAKARIKMGRRVAGGILSAVGGMAINDYVK